MTYSIRPLAREDLAPVNEIDREAFPTQWPPANYRQELQNKLAHYLVAQDDTRVVADTPGKTWQGLAELVSRLKLPWPGRRRLHGSSPPARRRYIVGFSGIWLLVDEAHITNIAVREEYRRRGIGELLLIATIDLSRELKASIMTLEVRASNKVAQDLYGKYGFSRAGLRRGYYLDNREDAIIMTTDNINSPSFLEHLRQLREGR